MQHWQDGPHLSSWDLEVAIMLAVTGPLGVTKFSGIKETGQGIVVFLGVFLVFEGSDSIIFCMVGIRLSSLLGGNGQDLVINRFADAGTVLGHGVGPPDGMDITGRCGSGGGFGDQGC